MDGMKFSRLSGQRKLNCAMKFDGEQGRIKLGKELMIHENHSSGVHLLACKVVKHLKDKLSTFQFMQFCTKFSYILCKRREGYGN